jgi:Tfp pilus assembly protein PilV
LARRLRGGQAGFTLVEVMVGAMVTVIGVGAVLYGFVGVGKGSETAQRQDVAAAIATQELERMRSYPYSSLALSSNPVTLPDGRLVNGGTQFQATSAATEDLVSASAGSSLAPSSTVAAIAGRPGYTVYRVISWADQSCPLTATGLNNLSNALAGLAGASAGVQATLNGLNGAVSGTTSLSAAVGDLAGLLGGLLSSAATALRNDLNSTIGLVNATTGLQSALSPITGDLSALQSAGLIDSAGHLKVAALDLCHLPRLSSLLTLPDLAGLTGLSTALTGSGGVQANLTDLQARATAAAGFTLLTPAATITGTDASVQADNNSIQAAVNSSGSLSPAKLAAVDKMLKDLANVLTLSTGTHVMKRISVAVVLDPSRSGVGPAKAVWMSSLMSDPQDGLL